MDKKEPVNTAPKYTSEEKPLRIRRGRVDSVDLYEIKDGELDLIEKGPPTDLYLNFCIFLFSIAFSALVALCTTTNFKYAIMKILLVVIIVVGFLVGSLLLLLWRRDRGDVKRVIQDIRKRIPPEGIPNITLDSAPELGEEDQAQPTEPKG